jgi:hypothetical protein
MPLAARRTPTTAAARANATMGPARRSQPKSRGKNTGRPATWSRDDLEPAINEARARIKDGNTPNYRQLHDKYGIPKSSLKPYVNNKRQTRQESHAKQMLIDPTTETVLIEWCTFCGLAGIPWSYEAVR